MPKTTPHPYPCPRDPDGVPYDPLVQATEDWRAIRILPAPPLSLAEEWLVPEIMDVSTDRLLNPDLVLVEEEL